jgi:hypothetical protein
MLCTDILFGGGKMDLINNKYRCIFYASRQSKYLLADMNNSLNINILETIPQWQEQERHEKRTGRRIIKMLMADHATIYFILYYKDGNRPGYQNTMCDVIIDEIKTEHIINIKAQETNFELSFAKIENRTLFFTFSDEKNNLYAINLDGQDYKLNTYIHDIDSIIDIWVADSGSNKYFFTSLYGEIKRSGILEIPQDNMELRSIKYIDIVIYSFNLERKCLVALNKENNYFLEYDNNIIINLNDQDIFDGHIGSIFYLESNNILIEKYKIQNDPISNILFGSKHYYKMYEYVLVHFGLDGKIIQKKVSTFNKLWKLEQIIFL